MTYILWLILWHEVLHYDLYYTYDCLYTNNHHSPCHDLTTHLAMLQYQIELRRDGQVSQEGEEDGEEDGEDDGEGDEDGRRRRGRPRKYVLTIIIYHI